MAENVVVVKNVKKAFKLPKENHSGLKQALLNVFNNAKGYDIQQVLKGVSFNVEQGDFFGIVGRNGSGKSTILKLLAGIYTPEDGSITSKGSIVPFIELGVGFNPELTGRENVFLNGALLGFSRQEVLSMYDDIVEFAELTKFMDQKLKNYSSGMQVRLAFSIAIKAQGDILILDEVLAVGDEAFQRKCDAFFEQIKKDKTKTVILVTHSMGSVKRYCNKAILLKDGKVIASGDPDEVANQYTEENLSTEKSQSIKEGRHQPGLNDTVPYLNISSRKKVVSSGENFNFSIGYDYRGEEDVYLAFSLLDIGRGGIIYDSGSQQTPKGKHNVKFSVPSDIFNSSDIKIVASLRLKDKMNEEDTVLFAYTNEANSLVFSIRNDDAKSNYALINKEYFIVDKDVTT